MKILKFLGSNWSYVLWFVIYFTFAWAILGAILGAILNSFIIVLIIYGLSVTIALCPAGEFILRVTEGCREPVIEQEQNYLLPMFEEVYQDAKEVNPSLNNGIKLYIMDAMYVNAFAIGRKTVAITMGANSDIFSRRTKGYPGSRTGTHGIWTHKGAFIGCNRKFLLFDHCNGLSIATTHYSDYFKCSSTD